MHITKECPSEAKIKASVRKLVFGKRIRCPYCKSCAVRKIECRFYCRKCRKKFSLISVSWLSGMKLSWSQFWILLRSWQTRQALPSACELAHVSIPTARRWYRRFQYHLPYEQGVVLSGEVEIDEAFIGKRRNGNQRIIIGAYERKTGKIALKVTSNRTQETTDKFILKHVQRKTTVYTDCFSAYEGIDSFFGYTHKTCNHSQYIFGPTNRIEGIWSIFKHWIRRSWQQVKAYLLPYFVREFEARNNEPELFETVENYLTKSLSCSISFTWACPVYL